MVDRGHWPARGRATDGAADEDDGMPAMGDVYGGRTRTVTWPTVTLEAVAVSSFHVALLVAAAVLGLHLAGAVGDLLGGLGTALGLGIYAYLWLVTWWTNRRVLRRVPLTTLTAPGAPRALLRAALPWGAATGATFVAPLALALVVGIAVNGRVLPALLIGGIAVVLAAGVGAAVGLVLSGVDVAIVRAAAAAVTPDAEAGEGT